VVSGRQAGCHTSHITHQFNTTQIRTMTAIDARCKVGYKQRNSGLRHKHSTVAAQPNVLTRHNRRSYKYGEIHPRPSATSCSVPALGLKCWLPFNPAEERNFPRLDALRSGDDDFGKPLPIVSARVPPPAPRLSLPPSTPPVEGDRCMQHYREGLVGQRMLGGYRERGEVATKLVERPSTQWMMTQKKR
jgi:hypothetical protein